VASVVAVVFGTAAVAEVASEESYSGVLKRGLEQDRLIPLKEFLSMKHPGHAAMLKREAWSPDAALFYAQGWGFMNFLLEKYGEGFTKQLTKTLMKGGSFQEILSWLGTHTSELKDPAAKPLKSIDECERAWRAWLEKRYR
jgi:hypothetical protein